MAHTQKESLSLFLNAFFLFFSPFLFFLSFFNFLSLFFSCVHATLHSLCLLVGQSVVSLVTLYFLVPFFFSSLLLPNWRHVWPLPTRTQLWYLCMRPCFLSFCLLLILLAIHLIPTCQTLLILKCQLLS